MAGPLLSSEPLQRYRALGLAGEIGDDEAEHRDEASVPIAASSRDQAQLVYMQAEGFVLRSPWLSVRFKPPPTRLAPTPTIVLSEATVT